MPAGLTVFNTDNTVQVDENWRNYGFRQVIPATITATTASPPNPAGYNSTPFSFSTPGTPALLVGCAASTLIPLKVHQYYDGSNWTFNWLFVPEFVGSPVTETVKFYVFDTMDATYSNVGLEVFNSSGIRTFHSDAPVMKFGGLNNCSVGFSGATGRTYVPVILSNPLCSDFVAGVGYRNWIYGLRSSGNVITPFYRQPGAIFATAGAYTNLGLYAAIDVTGLS